MMLIKEKEFAYCNVIEEALDIKFDLPFDSITDDS